MRAKRLGTFRRGVHSNRSGVNVKKTVELEKEYEAEIEDIIRTGDHIPKIEDFIIFVPKTKQGEHGKFKTTSVGGMLTIGELVNAQSDRCPELTVAIKKIS